MKLLVVVDMQNDFIDGALGTKEAVEIVPNVIDKIKSWDGDIICTQDTHNEDYLDTREGKHLPIKHCIRDTEGHKIAPEIFKELCGHGCCMASLNKYTFGSTALPEIVRPHNYDYIELIGLCTDICVVSKEKKARKQRILEVLAAKEDADLQNKSPEELQAMLSELDDDDE